MHALGFSDQERCAGARFLFLVFFFSLNLFYSLFFICFLRRVKLASCVRSFGGAPGSVDVTWGECGGTDGGAAPCKGIYSNESQSHATVHDKYGAWLQQQPIPKAAAVKYNVTNAFELDFAR